MNGKATHYKWYHEQTAGRIRVRGDAPKVARLSVCDSAGARCAPNAPPGQGTVDEKGSVADAYLPPMETLPRADSLLGMSGCIQLALSCRAAAQVRQVMHAQAGGGFPQTRSAGRKESFSMPFPWPEIVETDGLVVSAHDQRADSLSGDIPAEEPR
jgi:hypothetical protein